jgi:hypothetical protein
LPPTPVWNSSIIDRNRLNFDSYAIYRCGNVDFAIVAAGVAEYPGRRFVWRLVGNEIRSRQSPLHIHSQESRLLGNITIQSLTFISIQELSLN